ncbi:S-crystallin 4 isoform X1 [Strongylocentrotus purpuratus]|uniref:Glutathione transferase n=1 Tax=Strongylocentrotus purpuratus TaxID=7668 RepID=A0A7M7SVU8_STRPU|nr:S-crystallin 4 isoform X1 [Strongylocentrotus purpuratus]
MPNYKLIYFNARGWAEPARMMFALAGCEYVDDRFTHKEWPERKTDKEMFPIGQAPVLLVDDKVIPQSAAISRYLARELNFYGANSLEAAQIDVVLETMADIEDKMMPLYADQDAAKKAEVLKAFVEITSKPYFTYLEQLIEEAGGKHFVGNKVSLADIHIFNMLDMMTNSKYKIEGLLDSYPQLRAFCKSFRDEGPLKSYLESRPVTEA